LPHIIFLRFDLRLLIVIYSSYVYLPVLPSFPTRRSSDLLAYHTHRAPTVAVIHGVAMGGGLGISINGSHREVTKKVMMAMPETRSEEHTSELQSRFDLVCRLLLEKKKKIKVNEITSNTKQ